MLYLRGGIWHCRFGLNGEMVRKSTGETDEKAARKVEARLMAKVEKEGRASLRRSPRLADYVQDEFLPWVANHQKLRPATKTYYNSGWRLLSATPLADMRLDKIRQSSVDTTTLPGAPANQNMAIRTLRRILGRAAEDEVLSRVPKITVRPEEGRTQTMSAEDERRVGPFLTQDCRDVLAVLRDTGCRPSECYAMEWSRLDWTLGLYFVPRGKTPNAKRALPPLSDRVLQILHRRHMEQGMPSKGWIFPSPRKAGRHIVTITDQFRDACRKAGLPEGLVVYSARHDAASFMMRTLQNPKAVADLLGHSQASTTLRYYVHTHDSEVQKVKDAFNERNLEANGTTNGTNPQYRM